MKTWLINNISTIVLCLILAAVVAAIIIKLVRDKKNGKCSCGGNCGQCSMNCHCNSLSAEQNNKKAQ